MYVENCIGGFEIERSQKCGWEEIHSCSCKHQRFPAWMPWFFFLFFSLWYWFCFNSLLGKFVYLICVWMCLDLVRDFSTHWKCSSEASWDSSHPQRNGDSFRSDQDVWRGEMVYVPEMQAQVGFLIWSLLKHQCTFVLSYYVFSSLIFLVYCGGYE